MAEAAAMRIGEPYAKDIWWSFALVCAAFLDVTRARAILDGMVQRIPVTGQPVSMGASSGLLFIVHALTRLGETERAAALYPVCVERMELGYRADYRLFEEAAGRAAAAGRDWETAERHFTNALRVTHMMPHVPGQADIRLAHAEMLLARRGPGDAERARTMLQEAAPMFERAGRTRWLRECRRLLAGLADA